MHKCTMQNLQVHGRDRRGRRGLLSVQNSGRACENLHGRLGTARCLRSPVMLCRWRGVAGRPSSRSLARKDPASAAPSLS